MAVMGTRPVGATQDLRREVRAGKNHRRAGGGVWWGGLRPASWEPPDCAIHQLYLKAVKVRQTREFPDSLGARTPRFHCQGHGFNPWLGNKFPQATRSKANKQKTKRTESTRSLHSPQASESIFSLHSNCEMKSATMARCSANASDQVPGAAITNHNDGYGWRQGVTLPVLEDRSLKPTCWRGSGGVLPSQVSSAFVTAGLPQLYTSAVTTKQNVARLCQVSPGE